MPNLLMQPGTMLLENAMICKRAVGACRPMLYFPFIAAQYSLYVHVCLAFFYVNVYFVSIFYVIMCCQLGVIKINNNNNNNNNNNKT